MPDEVKDPRENEEEEKGAESFEDQIDDLFDTLDLKSTSEEDPEKKQESKEEGKEDSEGGKEEDNIIDEDEKIEKGELSEEEEESEVKGLEEEEKEEEEDVASPDDELAFYKEQNKKLLERLEAEPIPAIRPVEPIVAPVPVQEVAPTPVAPVGFKGFLDGEDIDEVVSDPAKLESLLLRVSEHTKTETIEQVLRSMPNMIVSQVQQQTLIKEAVDDFYDANEDLRIVKRQVGIIANEVAAEDPTLSLDKVFKEAAVRTRKALGLKEFVAQKEKTRKTRRPALRQSVKRANRDSGPSLSETEKDIAETFEL